MMFYLDPAALSGLAGLIALAGWAVGRMQAGRLGPVRQQVVSAGLTALTEAAHAAAPPVTAPAPDIAQAPAGAACQQRALEERRELLAAPISLADLHAEVRAIRLKERILQRAPQADALLVTAPADHLAGCRFIGLSGRPTCPASSCDDCRGPGACQEQAAMPAVMASPERC